MVTQDADKKAIVTVVNGIITGVDQDPIKMGTTPNQKIEWSIRSADANANYTFPANGIVFGPGVDPGGQFNKIGPVANGKKYQWHDKNSDIHRYKYTVNIMNGTTPLAPLDPIIANGE